MQKISSFRNNYYFLSNFYPCRVAYNNIVYENAEAAFQAQKCKYKEDKPKFCSLKGADAKKAGQRVVMRDDWEIIKKKIMHDIVFNKFVQNENLRIKLICTGNDYLEEANTWGDTYWGTCCGEGDNVLGKILMEVREELTYIYYGRQSEFIVLEKIDLMKYVSPNLLGELDTVLKDVFNEVKQGRVADGRYVADGYYVCRKEEPYANLVNGIIELGEKSKN